MARLERWPEVSGVKPLRRNLAGKFRLRTGDWRVVFRVAGETVYLSGYVAGLREGETDLDVAYDLLFQDTEPSWLVMVDRGATTIWEEWGGIDADGTPHASLNHYSKGAVIGFLHHYVAGLQLLDAGYRRFLVAPRPGGGITWAHAHHDSPYGRITVQWKIDGEHLAVGVDVPTGTTAEVQFPSGDRQVLPSGRHDLRG
jgi:alpha-L-rhamnosidase